MPSPNVWVIGEAGPSNRARAPAISVHPARRSGATRAAASTKPTELCPSARSSRRARASSTNGKVSSGAADMGNLLAQLGEAVARPLGDVGARVAAADELVVEGGRRGVAGSPIKLGG